MAKNKKHLGSEVIKKVKLSFDRQNYDIRLTKGWAESIMRIAPEGSDLDRAVFDFAGELRTISMAARMPYDSVGMLVGFHASLIKNRNFEATALKAARVIAQNLVLEVPGLSPEQAQTLRSRCLNLVTKTYIAEDRAIADFNPDHVWEHLIATDQFRFSLRGIVRLAYVSTYNAYESLVMRCVRFCIGQPSWRKKNEEKFIELISRYFGVSAVDTCWSNERLKLAREVRHSLSHAAGERTRSLSELKTGEILVEGYVEPMASDLQELIKTVESSANYIVSATKKFLESRLVIGSLS